MENFSLEGGSISEEDAKEMTSAYQYEYPDATKSVWFSLDQINRLVKVLNEGKANGTDGLRVYFGRYTVNTSVAKPEYIGRNTVLFVPTKTEEEYGEKVHADYFVSFEDLKQSVIENNGELCPPVCTGTKL